MIFAIAGQFAGAVATFGRDRVMNCLSRVMSRPVNGLMNAASVVSHFVTSFFHSRTSQPSRRPGGVAAMAASALSTVTRCFSANGRQQQKKK